ncbi:MAG: tRNA dihydrouridine synthase DusB, partial [Armatimonadota bacterium]
LPFRVICRRGGAGLVMSEMVSARALHYGSEKTEQIMQTSKYEHPVALQVFGDTPELLYNSVAELEAAGADIIDLNMGCSVPKVRKSGAGVQLMADPDRGVDCAAALVDAASVPVTVKMRAGMTEGDHSYLDLAARMVHAGVAAVALHARTADQMMGGEADWNHISRMVEAVDVPVIGNGDLHEPQQAVEMMAQTGCAGVMFARGALSKPWIFRQTEAALTGRAIPDDPSIGGVMAIVLLHGQMLALELGERTAIHRIRGHMAYYSHGLPNATHLRREVQSVHSLQQLRQTVTAYVNSLR